MPAKPREILCDLPNPVEIFNRVVLTRTQVFETNGQITHVLDAVAKPGVKIPGVLNGCDSTLVIFLAEDETAWACHVSDRDALSSQVPDEPKVVFEGSNRLFVDVSGSKRVTTVLISRVEPAVRGLGDSTGFESIGRVFGT